MKRVIFSEGDYLEGLADTALYTITVQGYFAGGSSLMVKRGKKWEMVSAHNLKPTSGGSTYERSQAMRTLQTVRKRTRLKSDRKKREEEEYERLLQTTDWDGLKEKVITIASLLKTVQDSVPKRFYATKTKQLSKAWADLDRKQKPGWDWDTFLAELESEIEQASKRKVGMKRKADMNDIKDHPAVKALENWWLYEEQLLELNLDVLSLMWNLVAGIEEVAEDFPDEDLKSWLRDNPDLVELVDAYREETTRQFPKVEWTEYGRDLAESRIVGLIMNNLTGTKIAMKRTRFSMRKATREMRAYRRAKSEVARELRRLFEDEGRRFKDWTAMSVASRGNLIGELHSTGLLPLFDDWVFDQYLNEGGDFDDTTGVFTDEYFMDNILRREFNRLALDIKSLPR